MWEEMIDQCPYSNQISRRLFNPTLFWLKLLDMYIQTQKTKEIKSVSFDLMKYRYTYIDIKYRKRGGGQQILNIFIDENYSARVIFTSSE